MQDTAYHNQVGLSIPQMEIISTEERLSEVMDLLIENEDVHALDFETTSLRPEEGDVRITSIYGPCGFFVIDHFKSIPFSDCAENLARATAYCVFNVGFEGRWFDYDAPMVGTLYDIAHLRKAKLGGGNAGSLADVVKRELKIELNKDLQNSDWAKDELTPEQYRYAGLDAFYTYKVWEKWMAELTDEQWAGYLVMNESWRGVAEMEDNGLPLDVDYHKKMMALWQLKKDTAERYIRKFADTTMISNLNSRQQIGKFIKDNILTTDDYLHWPKTGKTKQMEIGREVLDVASRKLPYPASRWLAAVQVYNYFGKYLSTYGQPFITSQEKYGRVKSRTNIAAAVTGRLSTSSVSIQNIPKSPVVRRSFVADPRFPTGGEGDEYRFVMADYSSIEVRVLGEISKDAALINEAIYGDIHVTSASDRFKIPREQFVAIYEDKTHKLQPAYKAMRSSSKATTFSVCYGAGIPSLALKLRCTEPEAAAAMELWAQRYPKAYAYRQVVFENLMRTGFIPLVDGRSIFVWKEERTLPVAANYGIQGVAASVMYRAIYHTQKSLYDADIRTRMGATIHDELILRSHKDDAEQAKLILEESMEKGWLDVFPGSNTENLADAAIAYHWGQK